MRSNRRLFAIAGIVASGGLFACVGGAGSPGDAMTMWEPSASSYERAESSHELAPPFGEDPASSQETGGASAEPGPGAQGGGGAAAAQCAGTFTCVEDGDDETTTLTLTAENGGCSVAVEKTTLVLGGDGAVTLNGQNVGTWQATSNGFTAQLGNDSITCTRGGSGSGPGQGTGGGGGGGGGSGSGSGGGRTEDDAPPVPPNPGG